MSGTPLYNDSESSGHRQHKATPKEYYQASSSNSHRQHHDERNPYWDGSQWQYYNPSSEIYGHPYYQDPYYRRDFDSAPPSYQYNMQSLSRPYHINDTMPGSSTPTMAMHPAPIPASSSIRNQHDHFSRSPKRRRTDSSPAIDAADSNHSNHYIHNSASQSNHPGGQFDESISWRQNPNCVTRFYDTVSDIEPAPLTSSNEHFGHIYSSYDHVPSSSSTNRSSYGSYAPNTPYQPEVKSSYETEKDPNKIFVTPEHISSEQLSEIQDISSSSSSQSTDHIEAKNNRLASTSGTKRPATDRKQLQSKAWYERYEDLKEYKEKHGDCLVPQKYPPNPSLGIWVNKQRMEYKLLLDNEKSSMSPDRLEALQSIGFVWAKRKGQATWDTKYKQLLEYKAEHGDCLIPTKYAKNPALGRWVSTQREHYRMWKSGDPKSKMTEEKAKLLDDIGFVWRLQF